MNYEHIVLNTKILLFLLSTNNFIVFLFVYSKDTRKVVESVVFVGTQESTRKVVELFVFMGTQKDTHKVVESLVFMGTQKDTHKVVESHVFVGTQNIPIRWWNRTCL